MKKMNKKGFTLVEIMIVVAIIGLLAAIGIPSFTKARDNSRAKACVNNLRMIAAGGEQHMMEVNATIYTTTEAAAYIKGGLPACPQAGTYGAPATANDDPTCSLGTTVTPNHAL